MLGKFWIKEPSNAVEYSMKSSSKNLKTSTKSMPKNFCRVFTRKIAKFRPYLCQTQKLPLKKLPLPPTWLKQNARRKKWPFSSSHLGFIFIIAKFCVLLFRKEIDIIHTVWTIPEVRGGWDKDQRWLWDRIYNQTKIFYNPNTGI